MNIVHDLEGVEDDTVEDRHQEVEGIAVDLALVVAVEDIAVDHLQEVVVIEVVLLEDQVEGIAEVLLQEVDIRGARLMVVVEDIVADHLHPAEDTVDQVPEGMTGLVLRMMEDIPLADHHLEVERDDTVATVILPLVLHEMIMEVGIVSVEMRVITHTHSAENRDKKILLSI
jgi:hypothetical protein